MERSVEKSSKWPIIIHSEYILNNDQDSDMAEIVQLNEGMATTRFLINKPVLKIGRDPASDISIDDALVSKEHALIEVVASAEKEGEVEYYIKDLDSTNNTYINEQKVTRQQLKNNDVLRVGLNNFKFVDDNKEDFEKTKTLHKSWFPGVFYTK